MPEITSSRVPIVLLYLIQKAYRSSTKLSVERIGLWQLHRIDALVPQDEQFEAIRQLIVSGVIRYAGLSEVDAKMTSQFTFSKKGAPVAFALR
ncbi:hypothetical protein G6M85_21930 [Agrobacterium tumefaciens]|uniref:aldo/keto reductase n=1 Tax=Agrobacterium tumefaciens TaxID=358 RepID=UPI0015749645|nr:hypothetical protein [Agrobacterium tumefaciens]